MMTAEQHIIDYVKTHDRRNSLLYNNRCFLIYINPSDVIKRQYEANRSFILEYFKK